VPLSPAESAKSIERNARHLVVGWHHHSSSFLQQLIEESYGIRSEARKENNLVSRTATD
jgi:hypothetical protein